MPAEVLEAPRTTIEFEANPEARFVAAVDQATDHALQQIDQRYAQDQQSEANNLKFHLRDHTEGVIDRAGRVMSAIQSLRPDLVSEHMVGQAKLSAAFHDTIQKWDEVIKPNHTGPIRARQRRMGDNERDSAFELLDYTKQVNQENPTEPPFNEEDQVVCSSAIMGTVPEWDNQNHTMVQPNLAKTDSIVAHAVGLADINSSLMDGGDSLVRDSDKLFFEDNLQAASDLLDPGKLNADKQADYKQRILTFLESQEAFARGRENLLDKELGFLPAEVAAQLKTKLFNKGDEAVAVLKASLNARRKLSLIQLVDEMRTNLARPALDQRTPAELQQVA